MAECDHQRRCQASFEKYVEVLLRTGRHDVASKAIGCTTTTTWKWRNLARRDPKNPEYQIVDPLGSTPPVDFHTACEQAFAGFLETDFEAGMIEMAMGYDDPVIYQGRVAFMPDTTADEKVDPISGAIYFPPKLDPLTGEPIMLTIRKRDTGMQKFIAERRDARYKERKEVDLTTGGGKPIFFPAKATNEDDFNRAFGATTVKAKPADAD